MAIYPIFPTAIGHYELERKLSIDEKNFFAEKRDYIKLEGNYTSLETYILDFPEMNDIKKTIISHVQNYVNEVYKPLHNIECYITQSWLTVTPPGSYHHIHNHPNSFVSGVFYINVDENTDEINFIKDSPQFYVEGGECNDYNYYSRQFKVKPLDIIIFPSTLNHSVPNTINKNNRTSLSFNTFIKGIIGNSNFLTELRL
jgi:uncharacterized protein (TIGR02466 family)